MERENRVATEEASHLQTRLKAVSGELQDARSIISGLDADRESLERIARDKSLELERAQRKLEDSLKSMSLDTVEQKNFQRELEIVNREKYALIREKESLFQEKMTAEKGKELAENQFAALQRQHELLQREISELRRGSHAPYSYGQPMMMVPVSRRQSHEPILHEHIRHEPIYEGIMEESDDVVVDPEVAKPAKQPTKPKDPNAPKRERKPKAPKEPKQPKESKAKPKQREPSPILDNDVMDLQEDEVGGILSMKTTDEAPVTSTPDSSFVLETDAEDGQRKKKRKLTLSRRGSMNQGKNSLLASAVATSAKKSAPSQLINEIAPKEVRACERRLTFFFQNEVVQHKKLIESKSKTNVPKPKVKTGLPKLGGGLVDPKSLPHLLAGFGIPKILKS